MFSILREFPISKKKNSTEMLLKWNLTHRANVDLFYLLYLKKNAHRLGKCIQRSDWLHYALDGADRIVLPKGYRLVN